MLPLLAALSPNSATVILTLGLALITVELNRPGSIVPGALGLLLTLLATASLYSRHPAPVPALEIAACVALIVFGNRIRLHWFLLILATVPMIVALAHLVPRVPGPEISAPVAVICGAILGAGTIVLNGIARRARQNKGLD